MVKLPLPLPCQFQHTTIDSLAECYEVSEATYRKLWALVKEVETTMKVPPKGEWPEVDAPCDEPFLVSKHWSSLDEAMQQDIIRVAAEE